MLFAAHLMQIKRLGLLVLPLFRYRIAALAVTSLGKNLLSEGTGDRPIDPSVSRDCQILSFTICVTDLTEHLQPPETESDDDGTSHYQVGTNTQFVLPVWAACRIAKLATISWS